MKNNRHPVPRERRSLGDKWADEVTILVGSWHFIFGLLGIIFLWIALNVFWLLNRTWDPYPFILLNFVLSTLAAIQAPIILMSQNRQSEKDKIRSDYDYKVNRLAEREITNVQKDLEIIKKLLKKK